jgi:hypothetical protein
MADSVCICGASNLVGGGPGHIPYYLTENWILGGCNALKGADSLVNNLANYWFDVLLVDVGIDDVLLEPLAGVSEGIEELATSIQMVVLKLIGANGEPNSSFGFVCPTDVANLLLVQNDWVPSEKLVVLDVDRFTLGETVHLRHADVDVNLFVLWFS